MSKDANIPPPQRFFVFWKYDLFPFVLGGEMTKMLGDGKVQVKGYQSYVFTPIKIFPYEEGLQIKHELEKLEAEYSKAQQTLQKEYTQRLTKLVPFVNNK